MIKNMKNIKLLYDKELKYKKKMISFRFIKGSKVYINALFGITYNLKMRLIS